MIASCSNGMPDDFLSLEKIDAHVHLNCPDATLARAAERCGFRLLTINTDYPAFAPLPDQEAAAIELRSAFPGRIAFATTFGMRGWGGPDWAESAIDGIAASRARGACALKVWKNIGMEFMELSGHVVTVDDPRLDPVFAYVRDEGFPVIGHQGEPRDCWLPLGEMGPENKEYFSAHPEYHMLLHPEYPSYEAQLAARDAMLRRNPGMIFVSAHLASLEWSVDAVASFLDAFPSACVDTAARMGELRRQAIVDRERVRDFFLKYADRILYGTDLVQDPGVDSAELAADAQAYWLEDWRFLAEGRPDPAWGGVSGLALPRAVLEKIYANNALRLFGGAWC
jgi:Predicted metal-dependent hydrolase of the TIM-barrel fold